MNLNKKLFWKRLRRAAIISIIVAVVGITIIHVQGIEDNAEAVAWANLFFAMVSIYLIDNKNK